MLTNRILLVILSSMSIFLVSLVSKAEGDAAPTNANVNSIEEFFDRMQTNGDLRSYYFTRDYTNPDVTNQASYSLGGNMRILTPPVYDFQIEAAYYTAQSMGLNSDNFTQLDPTLPGNDIGVLGQAYLQYHRGSFLIRAGDQLINTPWLAAGDSRMIPATYRGIYSEWTPNSNWMITGMRILSFKSRVEDEFSRTNLYNPQNFGTPIKALDDRTDNGAWALGINYHTQDWMTSVWGYQFLDFAKLLYGDTQYVFHVDWHLHPLLGSQVFGETGDGNNILEEVSSGKASSAGYGLLTGFTYHLDGFSYDSFRLTLGFNQIFSNKDAFKNGDIVSPYTTGYADDPLFTTSMIAGLVEKSSGEALKVQGTYFALDKDLSISSSFARYFTQPEVPNTNETDLDIIYAFNHTHYLHGFSIRDRFGVLTGDPTKGTFYYNRVMLQYSF